MKLYLKRLLSATVLLACVALPLAAQDVTSVWEYEVVGSKMRVKLYINGELRNFIFDTGGRTALTSEFCDRAALPDTDSMRVTDVNGQVDYYPIVTIEYLVTPDQNVGFTDVPALRLPSPNPFHCFGADGIIGSELLSRFIVTINPADKTITLTTSDKAEGLSLRKMHNFSANGIMPVIPLHIGTGASLNVLFDTGFGGFISLKNEDFDTLAALGAATVIDEGISRGSIGVAGMAATDRLRLVEFPAVTLAGTRFTGARAETGTPPFTLLGMELLDYGSVTIDYPRRRFYFNAGEKSYHRDDLHRPFSLGVDEGRLTVSSVWSEMEGRVAIGDPVTHINGKPAGVYDFCESITKGIPELKVPGTVIITVETAAGPVELTYKEE